MKNTSTAAKMVMVIITSVGLCSCNKGEGDLPPKNQSVDVKIEILKPTRLVDAVQIAGTVKAFEDVQLSPEEGGVVKEWVAKKGQYVHNGDLVVTLKDEV